MGIAGGKKRTEECESGGEGMAGETPPLSGGGSGVRKQHAQRELPPLPPRLSSGWLCQGSLKLAH